MSVFNNENSVSSAIESILKQSYKNFEFLILDDCSTDNSFEVIKNYEKVDNRIKIFKNKENIGLTKSLNFLISEATGSFIARQDGDDTSLEDRLMQQFDFLNNYNLDGCSTRAFIKNSNKLIPGISFHIPTSLLLKFKNPYIHGSLLLKKNVLEFFGGYDESFYYAQDYKLITEMKKFNYKIEILNKPLYILNNKNNISSNYSDEQKYFANCVKKGLIPNHNLFN